MPARERTWTQRRQPSEVNGSRAARCRCSRPRRRPSACSAYGDRCLLVVLAITASSGWGPPDANLCRPRRTHRRVRHRAATPRRRRPDRQLRQGPAEARRPSGCRGRKQAIAVVGPAPLPLALARIVQSGSLIGSHRSNISSSLMRAFAGGGDITDRGVTRPSSARDTSIAASSPSTGGARGTAGTAVPSGAAGAVMTGSVVSVFRSRQGSPRGAPRRGRGGPRCA